MYFSLENAASRWISVDEFLPNNQEIVAFWTKYPQTTLLFGAYIGDEHDGYFVSYIDEARYDGAKKFKVSDAQIKCWCRFGYPHERNELIKNE